MLGYAWIIEVLVEIRFTLFIAEIDGRVSKVACCARGEVVRAESHTR